MWSGIRTAAMGLALPAHVPAMASASPRLSCTVTNVSCAVRTYPGVHRPDEKTSTASPAAYDESLKGMRTDMCLRDERVPGKYVQDTVHMSRNAGGA